MACLDDVARAVTLAVLAYEAIGESRLRTLAQGWLNFVLYMQLEDGRFTNFIVDRSGRRNLDGRTSYPGGPWWTARSLQALATYYRVFGDTQALEAIIRCPIPPQEYPGELKTRALLTLAGTELLKSRISGEVRHQWQTRIQEWCHAMALAADQVGYVPDAPGERRVTLWGYHQLQALASAGVALGNEKYVRVAEHTVTKLVRPVLAGGFYYAYPDEHAGQCAYCVSPLAQGLADLHRATGNAHYQLLALRATDWFAGANDANAVMYDAESGLCLDGLTGTDVSRNCGAESAIEAGLAELVRRRLSRAAGRGSTTEAVR
jgi:hypothetical protein